MRELTPAAFAAEVAALTGRAAAPGEPFAVAVSGGPDSLALLALAHAAFGADTCALTVDHGLRAEAADEAAMVAALCAGLGVRHATLAWTGPKPAANLQAAARDARYALMTGWCAAHGVRWLATAHHADDQAETLLLRLARGAGSGGLAGIRARRELGQGSGPGVTLLRPLLGWRRAALRAAVPPGWPPVDDPANHAARFDRTRARALLAATPWLDAARLAASAAHLADVEAALDWTARLAWNSRVMVAADMLQVDAAGLPPEITRRLLVRALGHLAATAVAPDGGAIERWRARLGAGGTATLGGVKGVGGPVWRFSLAKPRR